MGRRVCKEGEIVEKAHCAGAEEQGGEAERMVIRSAGQEWLQNIKLRKQGNDRKLHIHGLTS